MSTWLKDKTGLLIIVFLAAVPLVFWLALAPISFRFSGFAAVAESIGQLTGLVGTVLFSISLVLATRLKFLEKIYLGPRQINSSHHSIGSLAFVLLLIHPLAIAIKYIPLSVTLAAQFLLPTWNDLAKTYGIFSLILMMTLLVLTFYLRPRYDIWKLTHKFLGLAFFLASLHIYFIPSDVSRSVPLRVYMLAIIALGLAAVVRQVIKSTEKKLPARYPSKF